MKEIECITRKWGSSVGIVIPKEIVEKEHIKPNEKVRVTVNKITLARDLWNLGPLVRKDKSTQKVKDELRAGW
jgi:antitoxin component of MazEF toxin-antitoxin module